MKHEQNGGTSSAWIFVLLIFVFAYLIVQVAAAWGTAVP